MDEDAPGYVTHPLHETPAVRLPQTVSVSLPIGYRAMAARIEIIAYDDDAQEGIVTKALLVGYLTIDWMVGAHLVSREIWEKYRENANRTVELAPEVLARLQLYMNGR